MASKKENIIRQVYFTPGGPASFSGITSVLHQAKKQDSTITKKDVTNYLQDRYTYVRHKKPRKTKHFLPKVLTNTNIEFQCDLSFHLHTQLKQLLVCVDAFSGKLMATEIHRKKPELVFKAFERLIKTQNEEKYPA